MKIVNHIPHHSLQTYIKQMWIIEEDNGINIEVNSFPVGYPFINVVEGYPFKIFFGPGNSVETNGYLAGQFNIPFKLSMKLIKRAITIQLQPYSIPIFFKISGCDVANQIIPLELLSKSLSAKIEDLICGSLKSEEVLEKVEEILRLKIFQKPDPRLMESVQQICFNHGDMSIKMLADNVNLTQRRLQQLYSYFLGVPAKTFSRIVKVQSYSYQALKGRSLEKIVPDTYCDQAHFINSIKELTGYLPRNYVEYILNPRNRDAYYYSNLFYQS